jgi:glutathione synthase
MPHHFLFVMDPIATILPDRDTTFVFMLESQRRGHAIYSCAVPDLFADRSIPYARVRRAAVNRGTPHYKLQEERVEALDWFDAIFMRKDPPVDQAYLFATYLLELADPTHTFVLNQPRGLRDANEKLYALHFPAVIPESLVTADLARLKDFLGRLGGEMIIKPLDGYGGSGIFHVSLADRNLNALLEASTANGQRLIMAQRYLPAARAGDKRVILLNGEAIGAVLRVPRDDEHRGNIHVGGTCVATALTARELEIVAALRPKLLSDGLYFVGLDIIGEQLTEVNVTSPTGIQEINQLNEVHLEGMVIDFVEQRLALSPGLTKPTRATALS